MKKYYFVNFMVVGKESGERVTHMSVMATDEDYFPILRAKTKIKVVFDRDMGQETNVVINNFQEVSKESFEEFHGGVVTDFAEL